MPVDPYPFEGCCEHASNAHSRKHCLLCDCERAPAVLMPTGAASAATLAQPAEEEAANGTNIRACGICHGLVVAEDREDHLDWHAAQQASLELLLTTMTRLAALLGVTVPEETL